MRACAALLAVAACAGAASHPPPPPRPAPVLVTVVVDQLAAWMLDERLPRLPAGGGFARLRREGTWWHKMRYAHAITDTAAGHAALYAGAPPRATGIFVNEILDATGEKISIFADARERILGARQTRSPGVSLAPLRLPTLADRLWTERPGAVILSVSLKDRAALLGGGRHPDAALWFDPKLDEMVTSSAVAERFPDWARPLGHHEALVARRADPWVPLDPAWLAASATAAENAPSEIDLGAHGAPFVHELHAMEPPARWFRLHPAADALTLELAVAGIDALARRGAPLLVAISLSSNDYIGHVYGPRSWESLDEMLRLDAALGRFLDALDARFGRDGWSLMLTGDHGVLDRAGKLVLPKDLVAPAEAAAQAELGPGPWVLGISDPYLLYTARAAALPARDRARLAAAVERALRARPEVHAVFDPALTPATCPPESDERVEALVCRALVPGRVDGLYLVMAPGCYFDPDVVPGRGVSHGTPWLYDRTVPLLVRAPGQVAAGRVEAEPVSYRTFAATAARLLGLRAETR